VTISGSSSFQHGDRVAVVCDPAKINRYNLNIPEDISNPRALGIAFTAGGLIAMFLGYAEAMGWLSSTRYDWHKKR